MVHLKRKWKEENRSGQGGRTKASDEEPFPVLPPDEEPSPVLRKMKQISMDEFISTNRVKFEERVNEVYNAIEYKKRAECCFAEAVDVVIRSLVSKEYWWEFGLNDVGKYPDEVQKTRDKFAAGLKKLYEAIPDSDRAISDDEELNEAIEAFIKPEEHYKYGITVQVPDDFVVYKEGYDPDYTWYC